MQERTKAGGKRMRGGGGHVCVVKYWEQWKALDIGPFGIMKDVQGCN